MLRGAAVGAADGIISGAAARGLAGEDPFDPAGMGQDLLLGGVTGGVGGKLGAAGREADEAADLRRRVTDLADNSPRPPRREGEPRTVAVMRTPGGEFHPGGSGSGNPVHDRVQAALDNVPLHSRSGPHGFCAEIDALSRAMHAGEEVAGGRIATAKVRGYNSQAHGTPHEPCSSCASVLEQLGVNYVP